jgi:UDP-N-acetylglucosamine transferase subunit ALG13
VLIVPLDWGLGHATRCIPIINELIAEGFEVLLGAENEVAALFQKEFPALTIIPIQGYRVTYTKIKRLFFIKMLFQFFKINNAIKRERIWLENAIKKYNIQVVISDNRFGLYHKYVKSVFITHQLNIITGNRFADKIAQKINYKYINHFKECWVPDDMSENNLAGKLSHPSINPSIPIKYIGAISRFKKIEQAKTIDLAVLISGPEPQRTIFENLLLKQMKLLSLKMVLVRGLPLSKNTVLSKEENLKIINHLPATALNELLLSTKMVIARSGYSTIMDLAKLQQIAILVPTPGQTEQEYLAKYLQEKKYCITENQAEFNLERALSKAATAVFEPFPLTNKAALKAAIDGL